jgi:hypothetical protein
MNDQPNIAEILFAIFLGSILTVVFMIGLKLKEIADLLREILELMR